MATIHVVSINTLTDLKNTPGSTENIVITLGQSLVGDGKGALYYFDATDNTTAEDTSFYNTVVPSSGGGRWKRVFTRTMVLPHGTLFMNNGKKEFFVSTATNSSGEATVNLTFDNTVNGTPIFNTILFDDSKATLNTSTPNDAVSSTRKSLVGNVLTHIFFRGNQTAVSILGVNVLGFRSALQGTAVQFFISGT